MYCECLIRCHHQNLLDSASVNHSLLSLSIIILRTRNEPVTHAAFHDSADSYTTHHYQYTVFTNHHILPIHINDFTSAERISSFILELQRIIDLDSLELRVFIDRVPRINLLGR